MTPPAGSAPCSLSHSTAAIAIGFAALPTAKIQTRRRSFSGGILSSAARNAGAGAADRIAAQYSWMSVVRASIGASGATAHIG